MKRLTILIYSLFLSINIISAQPSAVKKVQKSVFELKTYDKDGQLLSQSQGIFVGAQGEAVSQYKPFQNAYRAEVTDFSGKTYAVRRVLGANEIHNLVRFTVDGKTTPAKALEGEELQQGAKLYCVGTKQNGKIREAAVKNVEPFLDKYIYYTIRMEEQEGLGACPFVTEKGFVVGLLDIAENTSDAYSSDIRYAQTLAMQKFAVNDLTMQKIHLPIQLPAEKSEAQVAMMMFLADSAKYVNAARDFAEQFPTAVDGYTAMAQIECSRENFQQADAIMQKALKQIDEKDVAHYDFAKMMLTNVQNAGVSHYPNWTLETALQQAKAADDFKPSTVYKQLQAEIIFAQGDYQEALYRYMSLVKAEQFTAECYYQAARCKMMLKLPNEEVKELLDSAVNRIDSLNIISAAPYFWTRATVLDQMGKYRDAVLDYSRYQVIMNNRVNDLFYYTRFQAEVNGRLYQQALIDIQNCLYLSPQEPLYAAEKAQLELRLGEVEAAIVSANYCIKIAPENYTGYTLLALAQVKKELKTDALQNFQKAKELGDPQADSLIQKYNLE